MLIRIADLKDFDLIKQYDKHIAEAEITKITILNIILSWLLSDEQMAGCYLFDFKRQ